MNTLLLNEKTISALTKGLVAGVNNKAKIKEAITESMTLWILDKNNIARDALQDLWAASAHNKGAIAVLRTHFNTVSKAIKKANGDTAPVGLTVKDGILVEVISRTASKASTGGSGDGESTGESTGETDSSTKKPAKSAPMFDNIALLSAIKILDAQIAKETDEKALEGFRYALNVMQALQLAK